MRYFTRERYEAVQSESTTALQAWEQAGRDYAESLVLAQAHLPASARALAKESFHDAVVEAIEHPCATVVCVVLNAERNPWGRRGRFVLRFEGVVDDNFRKPKIGDWWLYQEVHVDRAGFAYDVLLGDSEMHLQAETVDVQAVTDAV